MVVVSTLNAPCIFRSFIGFIARELPPVPTGVAIIEGGGGGAARGSLPSRAVRLDLLLGLKPGGKGVEGLLFKKAGSCGDAGAAGLGSGADWLSMF